MGLHTLTQNKDPKYRNWRYSNHSLYRQPGSGGFIQVHPHGRSAPKCETQCAGQTSSAVENFNRICLRFKQPHRQTDTQTASVISAFAIYFPDMMLVTGDVFTCNLFHDLLLSPINTVSGVR